MSIMYNYQQVLIEKLAIRFKLHYFDLSLHEALLHHASFAMASHNSGLLQLK